MPAEVLTRPTPPLTDSQVNAAMNSLPPLHDNVKVIVQHLQAQITALAARVADLEGA